MNTQKGFASILLILLAVVVIGGLVYLLQGSTPDAGRVSNTTLKTEKDFNNERPQELDTVSFEEGRYEFSIKDNIGEDKYIASLNLENVTTTQFKFSIDVATQGGVGEISGLAQITDSKNAKTVVSESGSVCELTFEIANESEPPTIDVKENTNGCLLFHGSGVQFEHTFVKQR